MDESTQVFWLSMSGIIVGFLGLALKMCLKSKCSDVDCCHLLKIHRDVDLEERGMEFEVNHGIDDNSQNPISNKKNLNLSKILPV
jgi:hypothetical protein